MNLPNAPVEVGIVLVARICLGLFFFPSALGKLTSQRSFIRGTLDYRILPEPVARVFGFILPWIELGLALALIFGIALPISGVAASLLLLCFIAAVTVNLWRGREISCNCYGIAGTKTISWGTVVRNVLLLLLAVIVVGLAPYRVEPDQWLAQWYADRLLISSFTSFVLLLLLLAFCLVTIYLLEWTVDIYYRISHLKSSRR